MKFSKIIAITLLVAFLVSCSRVPITNRRQMALLPESTLRTMSLTNYRDFLKKHTSVVNNQSSMVKKVGNNMANAVEVFMKQNKKYAKRIKNFKWEFNLVQDKAVNAWCMPGGKVVVYTGLLPITKNETGLAVVMGHEIAHAIARHGNERMSQGLLTQMGGLALNVAMTNQPEKTKKIFMGAYGATTTVGLMLPFSRMHETEADKMGLVFMALAGYDPNAAIKFWERMAASKSGKTPEFLSTHPSDVTRIKKIKEFLPEAMKYYKGK